MIKDKSLKEKFEEIKQELGELFMCARDEKSRAYYEGQQDLLQTLEEDFKKGVKKLRKELLNRFNIDDGDLGFLNEIFGF